MRPMSLRLWSTDRWWVSILSQLRRDTNCSTRCARMPGAIGVINSTSIGLRSPTSYWTMRLRPRHTRRGRMSRSGSTTFERAWPTSDRHTNTSSRRATTTTACASSLRSPCGHGNATKPKFWRGRLRPPSTSPSPTLNLRRTHLPLQPSRGLDRMSCSKAPTQHSEPRSSRNQQAAWQQR